jgi:hypothetical protein
MISLSIKLRAGIGGPSAWSFTACQLGAKHRRPQPLFLPIQKAIANLKTSTACQHHHRQNSAEPKSDSVVG